VGGSGGIWGLVGVRGAMHMGWLRSVGGTCARAFVLRVGVNDGSLLLRSNMLKCMHSVRLWTPTIF
jgi:hypothetical protein